ncbi:hypothetical protein [Carnobacterium pleistocenium]|uniref:hypothetical protein n=1 Tax=Carnobacterium pleistocenium TaxID=181073 RepID=UPI0005571F21|nr:hypothetical protein [Carnobacterium pleistocenium]
MKKLSMTITMLTVLFILTSCGTSNEKEEVSSQFSIAESTSSSIDSVEQNDSSSSISSEVPAESTPRISENVIHSEEEAFTFIKEQTGVEAANTDIVYEVLESNEDSYVLKLISKSLFDQGGSGTVGLYTIYTDGTYETGQK